MVRSSSVALKFANSGKRKALGEFISEYTRVVSEFVNIMWEMNEVQTLPDKYTTSQVTTWLSARAKQAASKQASGMVRGTKKKQAKASKPSTKHLQPCLDQRFIDLDFRNSTSFDGWVRITSLGNKLRLVLPFKSHKHLAKMFHNGKILNSIRLSASTITFSFEIPDTRLVKVGVTLGVDVGLSKTISVSNGFQTCPDHHGWTFPKIAEKLSRRNRGSQGFRKAQTHRKNFINWSVNQLELQGVKQICREDISKLRKGKSSSRKLSHWTYADIFVKLDRYCTEHGVRVTTVPSAYTSQRCSVCGWVKKSNRNGEVFRCSKYDFITDADLNAAVNIGLGLSSVSRGQLNLTGFYWLSSAQKPIVSETQKIRPDNYYEEVYYG
jgi:IS605 OrfB family transposase